ncbi:hypothetical protein Tco_0209079 [Tanacetum coccineum]
MLSSTRVKPSTSASGSQPSGNTKKDKIWQTPSSTQKNKVKAHPRKVKSSLKNKYCVVQPKGTAHVQHSKLNANSELKCVKCNGCMLSDNHDLCVLDFFNNVNARKKSKYVNKSSNRKVWKPTGKVFSNTGYIWRPTGRTFTIVGNACPLTRITTTTEYYIRRIIDADAAYSSKSGNGLLVHQVLDTAYASRMIRRIGCQHQLDGFDMASLSTPALLVEIMSKGKWMTYEELCNEVLLHWPNLRKHNGERYAYSSHSQAVLDCLRNRSEWSRLIDRSPKICLS